MGGGGGGGGAITAQVIIKMIGHKNALYMIFLGIYFMYLGYFLVTFGPLQDQYELRTKSKSNQDNFGT